MKNTILIFFLISFYFANTIHADEGMWMPSFLKMLNEADMQKMGCKLSADEIYSVNQTSLKDAVILFGGGCTGEMISNEGLLVTNHHCGYSQIQSHSSIEHDYLSNGFWAKDRKDELKCPGLTVAFVIRIDDVTSTINNVLKEGFSESVRDSIIKVESRKIEKAATDGNHYNAQVRQFYNGNEFYLFVFETFRDIRLVGAPPESIGKFGGDTDNWIWPRHTGDFSLFRVYAGKDNTPADYSPDNVPFKPRRFFPVSLKGIEEGDFAMTFGFPGRTTEYLSSPAVELVQTVIDPIRVQARTACLGVWDEDMSKDAVVRIKYASKYARMSNYHKKWSGEIKGLEHAKAIQVKKGREKIFQERVMANTEWNKNYGNLLSDFDLAYKKIKPYERTVDYFTETISNVEIVKFANNFSQLVKAASTEEIKAAVSKLKTGSVSFYKDYNAPTDKKLFSVMLKMYYDNVEQNMQPDFYKMIESKYKGDFSKYAETVFKKSIFSSEQKVTEFLNNYSADKIKLILKDPAYILARSAYGFYETKVQPDYNAALTRVNLLNRKYMEALKIVMPEKKYYPDANSTLRVTYGPVRGYNSRDGLICRYYTTSSGILQKEDSTNSEFVVPKKLKELFMSKDFGPYANKNRELPVAFTCAHHTTGGNSGSPVIDKEGNLIGVNFDRNWEATASDIIYNDDKGRNLVVDIRYVLFVIDKFAGASNLVNEMKIVK